MAINLGLITVIVIVIVILVFVALIALYVPPPPPPNTSPTSPAAIQVQTKQYQALSYWGPSTDLPNGGSVCAVYDFPGTITGTTALQGVPRTNANILNNCIPLGNTATGTCIGPILSGNASCVDPDQISAKQQTRTCVGFGTNGIGCRTEDGNFVSNGTTNIFYTGCGLKPCTTALASLAVNFNFNPNIGIILNNAKCLYATTIGNTAGNTATVNYQVNGNRCDLSNSQLFRIQRASLSSTGSFKKDPTGNYAYFLSRDNNLCVVPSNTTSLNNSTLTLKTCSSGQYPWLLLPQSSIPGNTAGHTASASTAVQQFVYVPKPIDISTTDGLLELVNSNPYSITVDSSNIARMKPMALQSTQTNYSAQYLDYTLYNLILENTNSFPF